MVDTMPVWALRMLEPLVAVLDAEAAEELADAAVASGRMLVMVIDV